MSNHDRSKHDKQTATADVKHADNPDILSAQFGAEGLSLKVGLAKWAKTTIAILLIVGFLESGVIMKGIEIVEKYGQSESAHKKLVEELTEKIERVEQEKRDAEVASQLAITKSLFEKHFHEQVESTRTVSLAGGDIKISVFQNEDVLVSRHYPGMPTESLTWLLNPSVH